MDKNDIGHPQPLGIGRKEKNDRIPRSQRISMK